MPKRSPRSKLYEWRVIQIQEHARNAGRLFQSRRCRRRIRQAIAEREISNPHEQARLAAQRVKRSASVLLVAGLLHGETQDNAASRGKKCNEERVLACDCNESRQSRNQAQHKQLFD